MATKSEQKMIRNALDNQRQVLVRITEVVGHHPGMKRDANFGDVAACAVITYFELIGLLEQFDYVLAVNIVLRDLSYLNALKNLDLWPDESLLPSSSTLATSTV